MVREHMEASAKGGWVSECEFARLHGLARQTLANWRHRDRKAGRDHALPGYPQYRRFGRCVRYWLPADLEVIA
jgi:hypothetical protein